MGKIYKKSKEKWKVNSFSKQNLNQLCQLKPNERDKIATTIIVTKDVSNFQHHHQIHKNIQKV